MFMVVDCVRDITVRMFCAANTDRLSICSSCFFSFFIYIYIYIYIFLLFLLYIYIYIYIFFFFFFFFFFMCLSTSGLYFPLEAGSYPWIFCFNADTLPKGRCGEHNLPFNACICTTESERAQPLIVNPHPHYQNLTV